MQRLSEGGASKEAMLIAMSVEQYGTYKRAAFIKGPTLIWANTILILQKTSQSSTISNIHIKTKIY